MKQLSALLLAFCMLLSLNSAAQTQDSLISIPNGSFEQWSTGSGYSVTVLFFPLSVYSSYTYPTNWNYPTYPVNESITYSGITVNVNTNLPLLKVSNETSSVPEGSHALKLQSFMLSDIISSTVYSLAESSLDPMLTTTVFPTVLTTGVVDIDQLLPMMDNIVTYLGNMNQLLAIFDNVDINTLIDGGIALEGAIPDRLTGSYKYTSATSGDNGGIMMLGTKYNPSTHKRELVGMGYTTALTDTANYTPFEITYSPLSEINSSYPYVEADSLVILLFSSANTNPQQGSALFLDNLQLWAQQEIIPEDTCSAVFNLHLINVDTMHATIGWGFEGNPDHFEAEYGVQGFAQGGGTTVGVTESFLHLSDLQPDTYYDLYVRCVCDTDLFGEWAMMTFHTDTLVPPVIIEDTCSAIFSLTVNNVDTMHATIEWDFEGDPDHFEIEYGFQGFTLGGGIQTATSNNNLTLSDLQPNTDYDLYVRCVCDTDLFGEWAMTTFHTDTLVPPVIIDSTGIQNFKINNLLIYPNPANGQCVVHFEQEIPKNVKLYSIEGVLLLQTSPDRESMNLLLPAKGVYILTCEMKEGTVTRKIINQ